MDAVLTALRGAILPYIPEIAALLALILVTFSMIVLRALAQGVRQWGQRLGVQIEQMHADNLSAALERAARLALDRDLDREAAVTMMLDYVREALPDALVVLQASETALRNRATSALLGSAN